ncbi:hypothetical protein ATANTOWER_029435, partial [Ataeniobius toweri]|nr:hypothetical protein [Ataeniobius toweri]
MKLRRSLAKSPKPTEMGNDLCCLPEPEERYTGLILKAHLMQAEEKQAGAKCFLPPGEVKVDKEGANVLAGSFNKTGDILGYMVSEDVGRFRSSHLQKLLIFQGRISHGRSNGLSGSSDFSVATKLNLDEVWVIGILDTEVSEKLQMMPDLTLSEAVECVRQGIPQEGIRTLGQAEDFKLSSVHLHLTEGSPSACLQLLADWIRTIDLQIYLGRNLQQNQAQCEWPSAMTDWGFERTEQRHKENKEALIQESFLWEGK